MTPSDRSLLESIGMAAVGKLTVDDYRATPEGPPWYQLIEGNLLLEPSPSIPHQEISRNLVFALLKYLERHPVGKLLYAPFDAYLDEINVFQPDIGIILNSRRKIIMHAGTQGAPDFVVEILSPSTKRRDREHKKKVYARAGVRELWIVDPVSQRIDVYQLGRDPRKPVKSHGRGQTLRSVLFPGLSIPTDVVFAG